MRSRTARRNDWLMPQAGLAALRGAATRGADAEAPRSVHQTLRSMGAPLEPAMRGDVEARTGRDFSGVRVHTDEAAAQSARDVGALAYTVGQHVVFGSNRFAPGTSDGQKLLAHELTHVDQQRGAAHAGGALRIDQGGEREAIHAQSTGGPTRGTVQGARAATAIQRAPDPDDVKKFDTEIADIRNLANFKAKLDLAGVAEFDEIVVIVRARDNPLFFSDRLKTLFTTDETPSSVQAAETSKQMADAASAEKTRVGAQAAAVTDREEAVSKARAKKFRRAVGLDGTIFAIDDSDVADIAVRAQVRLVKKGTGTNVDIANVKALEDVIEKRASTLGYSLDVAFVNKSASNVFTVGVDTSEWTVSDNWVGDDVGLVHELHHLLGLEQDRYDYIEAHHDNAEMKIQDRVHWFREEFKKTIPNDTESMMNTGERLPLDDDICRVAGKTSDADVAACVKTRSDSRAAKLKPAIDQALDWLKKAGAAPAAKRETVANAAFTSAPDAAERDAAISDAQTPLTASNLQLFSALTKECEARPAFERRNESRTIGLCPTLFTLGTEAQARALMLEALYVANVGLGILEKDCKNAGCGGECGSGLNAKAWARFIECSGGP